MSIRRYLARDLRLRHLRLLVAIDDAGRLTRAAQLLHITQPALSKALGEIEQALGTPLFSRSARGLVPTPAGETLIRSARAILGELERAGAELEQPASAVMVLNVGAAPTSSWALLSDAVARLRTRMRSVTVNIVDGQTVPLLTQLVAGRLDLAVGSMWRSGLPLGVEALPLYEDRMCLVVASRGALARSRVASWQRIEALPWVLPPTGHPIRTAIDRAIRRCGWSSPGLVFEALSTDATLSLLLSLDAIALVPSRLARRLISLGLVKELSPGISNNLAIALPVTAFVTGPLREDSAVAELFRCLQEAV